jgi:acyl-CoA synthetase (AMP-forming)/AMP-acid ligase II
VAGVPDDRFGQRPAAVIQLRPGVDVSSDDLIAHAREHLAGYKAPTLVVVVPEIRRSPSGKADYPWAAKVAAERLGERR